VGLRLSPFDTVKRVFGGLERVEVGILPDLLRDSSSSNSAWVIAPCSALAFAI